MKPLKPILGLNPLSLLAFTHDVLAAGTAWLLAYWLRLNLSITAEFLPAMLKAMAICIPIQAVAYQSFGLYRGVWRYASLPDLRRIVFAVAAGAVAGPFVLLMTGLNHGIPRSVFLLQPILLLMIMGGNRMAYRSWKEHRLFGANRGQGEPVLVIGTGDAAITLIKDLTRSPDWHVVGLVDDNPVLAGRVLHTVRVVGGLQHLSEHVIRTGATHAIIAMPQATHRERRRIVELCREASLKVLTIPSFDDLMSGKVQVSAVRKVELDDLLGRDPVVLDSDGLKGLLGGNPVTITGLQAARSAPNWCARSCASRPLTWCWWITASSRFIASNRRSRATRRRCAPPSWWATCATPRACTRSCAPIDRRWYSTPPPTSMCR